MEQLEALNDQLLLEREGNAEARRQEEARHKRYLTDLEHEALSAEYKA